MIIDAFEPVPGVHRVEIELGERIAATYVVQSRRHSAIIDTGTSAHGPADIATYLDGVGIDRESVKYVINTHADFDHFGGNRAIRTLCPAARFVCHVADRHLIESADRIIDERYGEPTRYGFAPNPEADAEVRASVESTPVDLVVVDHHRLELASDRSITMIHLPGHSDGHLGAVVGDAVIIGDAMMADAIPTASGEPYYPPTYRRVADQRSTNRRVERLASNVLLTGHDRVMRSDEISNFASRTDAFLDRVERAVMSALSSGRRSLSGLVADVAPGIRTWPEAHDDGLAFPVLGHLEDLEERGLVVRHEDHPPTWSLRAAGR